MAKYTQEYLLKEYHAFRDIMCSTKYSIEQKQDAYQGLLFVYVNANLICEDRTIRMMDALDIEFARRISYEIIKPLTDLVIGVRSNG